MNKEKLNKIIAIQLIIATIIIVVLSFVAYNQHKEIEDLEMVLNQCEEAYYKLLDTTK